MRLPSATAARVNDLFIPGTRTWHEGVVHRFFMALEAEEVLKIKPSTRLEDDVLA
jgi:hypothetical protein